MAPSTSPSARNGDGDDSATASSNALSPRDLELQRKRARDRKSQQAMRDRNKWTIQTLSDQVACLSSALEERTRALGVMEAKLGFLESENSQLRTQNAALQLSLLGRDNEDESGRSPGVVSTTSSFGTALWELHPKNTPPSCLADQILQGFVDAIRTEGVFNPSSPGERAAKFPLRPNLCSLLDESHRSDDDISNVVADVLRTYREIEGLPKQVAVFYIMATLLKWMALLDKQSWDLMPEWLRPVPSQLTTPHSAWIDRIPWPRAREYLISHPEITLDDFAAPYSSGFKLNWPYDPASVLLAASINVNGTAEITINPVYEEHMRQIRHWTVGDAFRTRFPELTQLIDLDSGQISIEGPFQVATPPHGPVHSSPR
ncbi:Fc.00g106450.m01.CDS01 [Cosmosporella sp. VM-42]